MIRLLAFAGSIRRDSFNRKLIAAAAGKAHGFGADVTLVNLADFSMPLYDGDTEEAEGIPENGLKLRSSMLEHDALLIACPEYNGSITPLLKNVIDWTSRPSDDVKSTAAYRSKVAGLLSASPGRLGGMRGLVHVRAILNGIGVHVVPGDVAVGSAHSAFADDGSLSDEGVDARVTAVVRTLVETTQALKAGR